MAGLARAASPLAPRLVIMAKEPVAGRVKTRLSRGVGVVAATFAYRAMLTALVGRLSADPRWRTILAVSPDAAIGSAMLPAGVARIAQGRGELGQRLQRIAASFPGPLVIIGSDSPAVTTADIANAFSALGRCAAVFGPSADGGYWLVGLKRGRKFRAFDSVRWSTDQALADTRVNLDGFAVAELKVRADIDEAPDLVSFRRVVGRRVLPAV